LLGVPPVGKDAFGSLRIIEMIGGNQRLARFPGLSMLVVDKTGTLTEGSERMFAVLLRERRSFSRALKRTSLL
jgi:cation transport ATPase